MRTLLQSKFGREEGGNVAILFSFLMLPITLGIGVAVDFGRGNRAEADMQSALDGAAIAAIRATPDKAEEVGIKFFYANFKTAMVTTPVVNISVKDDGKVAATARASLDMPFGNLIGIDTFEVAASSVITPEREVAVTETSEVVFAGGAPCLHVMDQSAQDAMTLINNKKLEAKCDVRIRSNHSRALQESGSDDVKYRSIHVKGTASVTSALKITGWPYAVRVNQAVVANPYIDAIRDVVQATTNVGACTNANSNKTWTGTVQPGTYCGATTFNGATFAPGLYIIKSGSGNNNGSLTLTGRLDGSAGVSFYLADNKTTMAGYTATSGTKLVAPSTGTTRGLLIFENSNRGASWPLTMQNLTGQTWQGLIYLPSANLTMNAFTKWEKFNVSMNANMARITNWNEMKWDSYLWTPFNATVPITYSNETYTDQVTTVTEKPLYISK